MTRVADGQPDLLNRDPCTESAIQMTAVQAKREFDKDIAHVIAAYRFFSRTLPTETLFSAGRSVRVGEFEFEKFSQSESMLVELGWAFFTRCVSCLEALIHRLGIQVSAASAIIETSGEFSREEIRGFEMARELRNILLHGDGDWTLLKNEPKQVRPSEGSESHLFPERIERFHSLFRKVGDCIARSRRPVGPPNPFPEA